MDVARGAAVAQKFQIPRLAARVEELLDADDVQLVAVLTPPTTHAALAHAALDAGKHVFVEKPLTLDAAEGAGLAEHVRRANTKLFVGFNQRRHRLVQQAQAWLREGRLGALSMVHSTLTNNHDPRGRQGWHANPAQGGELAFEVVVHHYDLWRYLLGTEVASVSGQRAFRRDGAEAITLLAEMSDGLPVSGTFAEATTVHNELEIFGEHGRITLSLYRFDGLQIIPRSSLEGGLNLRAQQLRDVMLQSGVIARRMRRGGDYDLSYAGLWEHMALQLEADGPYEPNVYDGMAATRVALAVRQAIATKQRVELTDLTPEIV